MAIQTFTDLNTWKEGHQLVLQIYSITKSFPKEEVFGLISQLRRCAVSITSNIAEGFSRGSSREKIQFYHMAKGSLTELQNQILIARDVQYISQNDYEKIADQSVLVSKLLSGLIKSA